MRNAIILSLGVLVSTNSYAAQFHFFDEQQSPIQSATFGERILITVDGLPAKENCTVHAAFPAGEKAFRSQATFQVEANGSIHVDRMKPIAGTYSKADADGLFWSMIQGDGDSSLQTNTYTFGVQCQGEEVATAVLPRIFLKPGVRSLSLQGTGLVGRLFLPASDAPRPAIIAFSGSEGGAETGIEKAVYLANHGYVGLGIAYFNAPGVPKDLANIPLEYFESAIRYLQSRPEVRADKIGVMGVSRGGELALLLGATFPAIKAVVGQVPGPVKFGGNTSDGTPAPAWTLHDMELPAILKVGDFVKTTLPDGRVANNNRPAFEEALKDQAAVDRAFSPIERTNGPVLMFGGEDDQVWPSCSLIAMAMQRLKSKNHSFPDEAICYPHAGHGIGAIPGTPTTMTVVLHPAFNLLLNLGGQPEANAEAVKDSWARVFQFLKKNLD